MAGSWSWAAPTRIPAPRLSRPAHSRSATVRQVNFSPATASSIRAALVFNHSDALSYSGDISGNGSLTKVGSGMLILAATNTYTGATTIAAGTLQIGNGGNTGSLAAGSLVTDNAVLAFSRSDSRLNFGSIITGSGSVPELGPGTMALTASNNYTGGTTISGGVISLGTSASLGAATAPLTISGGWLNINSNSPTVGSLDAATPPR